jgi:SAM-dependent methyltransferase
MGTPRVERAIRKVSAGVRALRDDVRRERPEDSQQRRGESRAQVRERSKSRWRQATPSKGLTWGKFVTGDAFIERVESYGAFGADKRVLEIGPGYGRLLRACLERRTPFSSYTVIDLSENNIAYLSSEFSAPGVTTVVGDAESVQLDERFDLVMSSLTFKHLFPDFALALKNSAAHLEGAGWIFFDLIESTLVDRVSRSTRYFQNESTYLRRYTRREVGEILEALALDLVAFDKVSHDPDNQRMLVVARKGG